MLTAADWGELELLLEPDWSFSKCPSRMCRGTGTCCKGFRGCPSAGTAALIVREDLVLKMMMVSRKMISGFITTFDNESYEVKMCRRPVMAKIKYTGVQVHQGLNIMVKFTHPWSTTMRLKSISK